MAKFCSKCGRPLVEGVPCECEKQQTVQTQPTADSSQQAQPTVDQAQQAQQAVNQAVNNVTKVGSNILDKVAKNVKKIFKKPVDTIRENVEERDMKKQWLFLLINSVVYGLASYFIAKNFINSLMKTVNSLMTTISTLASAFGESVSSSDFAQLNIKIPFFQVFITATILMFLSNLILILIQKLIVGVIFKGRGKENAKGFFFTVHSTASIINTVSIALVAILSLMSMKIALLVSWLGMILYFVVVTQAYLDLTEIKETKAPFAIPLGMIFGYIFSFVISIVIVVLVISVGMFQKMASESPINNVITPNNIYKNTQDTINKSMNDSASSLTDMFN